MRDFVDILIHSLKWKIGKFSVLPLVFGIVMALLDVGMMGVAKLTHQKKFSYIGGLLLSTAIYAPQPYLFLKAMNFESMTAVNLIWNLSSNLIVTLMGVLYFGETIAGLRWVAIGMALLSLGLFAYSAND
jgi:EamA domain-containing membrane protein RarD